MTTLEIRNGHIAQRGPEVFPPSLAHELTFLHDAPAAIARANEYGSCLITGTILKPDEALLLGDLTHVSENYYVNNTSVIDCKMGAISPESIEETFRLADRSISVNANSLIIVNNLDALIGNDDEEPTKAQKLAIDSLLRWTSLNGTSPSYGPNLYTRSRPKVCALMRHPEKATHPLRVALLGTFVSRSAYKGRDRLETVASGSSATDNVIVPQESRSQLALMAA